MTNAIKPLTLYKIISLVLVVLCFVMMFLPWLTASISGYGMTENLGGGNVFEISGGESFWTVVLQILVILAFPAMIIAILGILLDRSMFVLPLAAVAVLMFLLNLFVVFWAKGQFKGYSGYGISVGVHAGIGAWLFLLFGLAAYGLLFYEDTTLKRNPFDTKQLSLSGLSLPKGNHRAAASGWQCPTCGTFQNANQQFCPTCGTRKPEPIRCPGCGKELQPGTAFCSNCGTKV